MTTGLLAIVAFPIFVAVALLFTSWAEDRYLREEHPQNPER